MRFTSLLVRTGLLTSLLSPSLAIAATPQTLLNQALMKAITQPHYTVSGTFAIAHDKQPLYRTLTSSSLNLDGRFTLSEDSANPKNAAATITLTNISLQDSRDRQSISSKTPMDFGIITHNTDLYFRITGINVLLSAITGAPVDASTTNAFNGWLKVDAGKETADSLGLPSVDVNEVKESATLLKHALPKAAAKRISPFTVLKTEKTKGNATLLRIHGKANPAFITFLEQEELKTVGKDVAAQKAVRARYTELRKNANNLRLVLIIDTKNTPTLTRIEFSYQETELTKGCAYTRADRAGAPITSSHRCNINIYRAKNTISGGINLFTRSTTVTPPTEFTLLSDAIDALMSDLLGASATTEDKAPEYLPMGTGAEHHPVMTITSTDHVRGSTAPVVTLIRYSDFQCPGCKAFTPVFDQVLRDFPNDVRVVYRHFPIRSIHEQAEKAAEAAECAAKVGGETAFWRMHDRLMQQENLSDTNLRRFASELALNQTLFNACLDSGEMYPRVEMQRFGGEANEVFSTPTTFINGLILRGSMAYEGTDGLKEYLQGLGVND